MEKADHQVPTLERYVTWVTAGIDVRDLLHRIELFTREICYQLSTLGTGLKRTGCIRPKPAWMPGQTRHLPIGVTTVRELSAQMLRGRKPLSTYILLQNSLHQVLQHVGGKFSPCANTASKNSITINKALGQTRFVECLMVYIRLSSIAIAVFMSINHLLLIGSITCKQTLGYAGNTPNLVYSY